MLFKKERKNKMRKRETKRRTDTYSQNCIKIIVDRYRKGKATASFHDYARPKEPIFTILNLHPTQSSTTTLD